MSVTTTTDWIHTTNRPWRYIWNSESGMLYNLLDCHGINIPQLFPLFRVFFIIQHIFEYRYAELLSNHEKWSHFSTVEFRLPCYLIFRGNSDQTRGTISFFIIDKGAFLYFEDLVILCLCVVLGYRVFTAWTHVCMLSLNFNGLQQNFIRCYWPSVIPCVRVRDAQAMRSSVRYFSFVIMWI